MGSIAAFLLPGADAVYCTVDGLAGHAIVSFDPNIRPAISGDRLNAITQVESIAERSDIVKMRDEDAAWLYPGWLLEAVADRLLGCGVRMVAITAGPTGALLASPCARVHVPTPTVKVRDTVGAGDTFSAGLIEAALRDNSLLDSLDKEALCRIGGLAAAAAVQRPGADPPTRGELARATRAAAVTECTDASIGVFSY